MVPNPKSNLVFDFPDPTPRFEFGGDSPFSQGPAKKGKRVGKLSKSNKISVGTNNNASPPKQSPSNSASTVATSSLSTLDSSNFGDNFFTNSGNFGGNIFADSFGPTSSPLKSRNNCGDIAAGPQNNKAPHFDIAPSQQSSPKLTSKNLPKPTFGRHSRQPSSASSIGYISEVSEFSFDRVTLATNETGASTNQSSTFSWNFSDGTMSNAVGQDGKQRIGDNKYAFVPYKGDADVVPDMNTATTKNKNIVHHQTTKSASTLSNVSLSDDEEMENIPLTDGTQSVVSEISERTGGEAGIASGSNSDAVDALLREGMESARRKHVSAAAASTQESLERPANLNVDSKTKQGIVKSKEGSCCNSSTSRNTPATANSSTSCRKPKIFLTDIQTTYSKFKTNRSRSSNCQNEKFSILRSIIEDVQFCGLYFCGIDTTTTDNNNNKTSGDKACDGSNKKRKQERKKEADDTFLGRVILCGNDHGCGGRSAFCGAL